MILWILMMFSILYCTAGKLKRCRNLREPFFLSLDCDGSEVVNCDSVVVDCYIVSFDMTDRWFGLLAALLGISSYAVSTLSADGIFFA
jgi:hypothetical protein